MIDQLRISGVDLNHLAQAIAEADSVHRQNILLRENFSHIPAGCACGQQYTSSSPWDESREHLQQVRAFAVVAALHRPCDVCLGTGVWRKFRGDLECPECDGRGRLLTPLPRMQFQDRAGEVWEVTLDQNSRSSNRAWVRPLE